MSFMSNQYFIPNDFLSKRILRSMKIISNQCLNVNINSNTFFLSDEIYV